MALIKIQTCFARLVVVTLVSAAHFIVHGATNVIGILGQTVDIRCIPPSPPSLSSLPSSAPGPVLDVPTSPRPSGTESAGSCFDMTVLYEALGPYPGKVNVRELGKRLEVLEDSCTIRVSQVKMSDAGIYICIFEGADMDKKIQKINLIVFESEPRCSLSSSQEVAQTSTNNGRDFKTDIDSGTRTVIEDSKLIVHCQMTYNGTQACRPNVTWSSLNYVMTTASRDAGMTWKINSSTDFSTAQKQHCQINDNSSNAFTINAIFTTTVLRPTLKNRTETDPGTRTETRTQTKTGTKNKTESRFTFSTRLKECDIDDVTFYSFDWLSPEIVVNYAVREVNLFSITPTGSEYYYNTTGLLVANPGQTLGCSAEGSPSPSYSWLRILADNITVVSRSGTFVVEAEGPNARAMFRCEATNMVGGITYVIKSTPIFVGSVDCPATEVQDQGHNKVQVQSQGHQPSMATDFLLSTIILAALLMTSIIAHVVQYVGYRKKLMKINYSAQKRAEYKVYGQSLLRVCEANTEYPYQQIQLRSNIAAMDHYDTAHNTSALLDSEGYLKPYKNGSFLPVHDPQRGSDKNIAGEYEEIKVIAKSV